MQKRPAVKPAEPAQEDGFAALVIAVILVLVLSLLTVGFAELMRHEERSALDKQLSSQAYYAAESGINDATKAINDGFKGGKTTCAPIPELPDNTVKFTDGENPTNASYPCLLINPAPPNLHYDPIATNLSRTVQFTAVNPSVASLPPAPVGSIKISWEDVGDNTSTVSNCDNFRTTTDWTYMGILRVQLIPPVNGSLDRESLTNRALTAFLCPSNSPASNTVNYGSSFGTSNGTILVNGNCSSSGQCSVIINNLPPDQATFFLNMRSIYSATSVTITAYSGVSGTGTAYRLKGAQTLIDSTGKAQDVLRRIQVRVASTNGFDIPDGTHADICKQFDLDPGATTPSPASAHDGCDTESLKQ